MWKISLCNNWPGIYGLGILSLIEAFGIFNSLEWIEWSILTAILAIVFGLEYMHKTSEGTCYCKIRQPN
jgi:hypothetical protein